METKKKNAEAKITRNPQEVLSRIKNQDRNVSS